MPSSGCVSAVSQLPPVILAPDPGGPIRGATISMVILYLRAGGSQEEASSVSSQQYQEVLPPLYYDANIEPTVLSGFSYNEETGCIFTLASGDV